MPGGGLIRSYGLGDLADVKKALESAISKGDIDKARMLSKKVGEGLVSRIAI